MKKSTKIGVGIGAGLLVGYLVTKAISIKNAVKQLTYQISNIKNLNIDINTLSLTANLTIRISNPTNVNLGINTVSLIKLTKIVLFDAETGNKIGTAQTSLSKIAIPSMTYVDVQDIPIKVPIVNGILGNSLQNLKTEITLQVFGKEYVLNDSGIAMGAGDPTAFLNSCNCL